MEKKFKTFDDRILNLHPDLKYSLKPNDKYQELEDILKHRCVVPPEGSFNTKIIIDQGQIVERVFKTPRGHVFSLFSNPSNAIIDQVA